VYGAFDPAGLSILLAGIPNYDRSILISNDSLGEELAKTIGDKNIVMMRGHGVTSCGPSIESATLTVVRVNDLAEMNYRAHLLGEPRPIPDIDLEEFAARGERGDPSSTGRRDSAWEAWKRIAEER
jgi:L-fuculose-phosphate aldolase